MSSSDLIVICTTKSDAALLREQIHSKKLEGFKEFTAGPVAAFIVPAAHGLWATENGWAPVEITPKWENLAWSNLEVLKEKSPLSEVFLGTLEEQYSYAWEINLQLAALGEDLKLEIHRLNALHRQIEEQKKVYVKAIQWLKTP